MFYSDRPITSIDNDNLGRGGFAKQLAQALTKLENVDTFTVGLYGKWGSGKTSLVNMMLNEIEVQQENIHDKNRLMVVHFEPWNFSDANQLLSQFFIRLSNEFRSKGDKNLSKIGDALETYSDAFDLAKGLPIVGGAVALLGKKCINALGKKIKKGSDEKDILKQKDYVIGLLKKQTNRILVVIDDIDRLNNEQIRQVFQLITSVAKFPNTVYFLVFDKEIVTKALEKVQEGHGEDYLEKIIQLPIELPDIQKEKLRQILFKQLDTIISEYQDIRFQQAHWQRLFEQCVDPLIKSIRDVNRLCNSVHFKLTTISSEIDFADMVAISSLEIAFPQIYQWIKNSKSILTGELDLSFAGKNKSQKDWYEFFYAQIRSFFHSEDEVENEHNAETAIIALSHLFPYFGRKIGKFFEAYDSDSFRKNNHIAHPEKFDRYFNFDLDSIGIKKSEIREALYYLNNEDFKAYLLDCDKKGTSFEFLEEVKAMIPEISPERAKVIIQALIDSSAKLGVVSNISIFPRSANSYAEYLIIELLDTIDPSERLALLSHVTCSASVSSMQSVAGVLNSLELRHGRLAAQGENESYNKVLPLEELIQLENTFTKKVKAMLKEYSLFDFGGWRIICYLLENFDAEYAKEYLMNAFNDDKNIVRYLDGSVDIWRGGITEYQITNEYKKYLTQDRVLQAIESQKNTGDLFILPEQIQYKCCAFHIYASADTNYRGIVSQFDVDKLLNSWKSK